MTPFRALKQDLEIMLMPPAWPLEAPGIPPNVAAMGGMETVSPLLALLPRGGLVKWRAVLVLGRVVAELAAKETEKARTVMRRMMWHLNEDSGNMGWGIAEAMGETLAQSPSLAGEYGKVALSYVRDTGFADNFIDHAALRRGSYWAIGRFAPLYPAYRDEGGELLTDGLGDEDAQCRGISAWGLEKLVGAGWKPGPGEREVLEKALRLVRGDQVLCEVLEDAYLCVEPAANFARQALKRLTGSRSV